ncbi:MAG: hypothetical protein Fur0032_09830 [Terrimicrobiaceae bacterium]
MKILSCLLASTLTILSIHAATLESAEVTAAINTVILVDGSASRPASIGDVLRGASSLETGKKSRAELTFNDKTIARLGANSVFSFSRGTRDLELNRGVILMQVPKAAGGATIQTAAVTAAITGTTIAIEYSPAEGNFPGSIKIFVLEGTLRAFLKAVPGESLLLEPGQMISLRPDAGKLPDAEVFDIKRFIETAGLMSDQFSELPSLDLIFENIVLQDAEKRNGRLLISNFTLHHKMPSALPFVQQNNQVNERLFVNPVPQVQPTPPRPARTPVPFVPTPPPTPPPSSSPPIDYGS